MKLAFRFPFSVVVGLICLTALLLLYAGSGRFGAPLQPSPNLDFGKAGLIDNSARLLDYAGHHGVLLKDYVRMTVRSAARVLHAPAGLEGTELARWLDRIGKARGVGLSCETICNHIANLKTGEAKDLARLFESAGDICRWKGEILHGFEQHRHPG